MANLQGGSDNHDNANVFHAHFGGLEQVVTDDAMSKLQKLDALDVLEQDARQLATASNEGMAGGEPTQLREVLEARQALESSPIALAYAVVLADLCTRRATHAASETKVQLDATIALLEGLAPNG
jgi:hypothetical protein